MDALFWRFIFVHKETFENNPRMRMMVNLAGKMPQEKLEEHISTAEEYLQSLETFKAALLFNSLWNSQ